MARYVDADIIRDFILNKSLDDEWKSELIDGLYRLPTAKVKEAVCGEWVNLNIINPFNREVVKTIYKCSACKYPCDLKYNYCPVCGADMRGKKC